MTTPASNDFCPHVRGSTQACKSCQPSNECTGAGPGPFSRHPMSDPDLTEMTTTEWQALPHRRSFDICAKCGTNWPCAAATDSTSEQP